MRFASRSMSDTMCDENTTARSPSAEISTSCSQELPPRHRVEARHGLIEDQQVRLVPEREQDRELLPLADGHVLDARPQRRRPTRRRGASMSVAIPARIERGDDAQLVGARSAGRAARPAAARSRCAPWRRPAG